jgi:hypothetical protein
MSQRFHETVLRGIVPPSERSGWIFFPRRTVLTRRDCGRLDHLLQRQCMEKEKIKLTSEDFPPARRANAQRFYCDGRGWRALPKGYGCFELKILTAPTAAPPH